MNTLSDLASRRHIANLNFHSKAVYIETITDILDNLTEQYELSLKDLVIFVVSSLATVKVSNRQGCNWLSGKYFTRLLIQSLNLIFK